MTAFFNNDLFLELARKWPKEVPLYLHTHFYRPLVHISQLRTNNRQASEDIVQDVLIYAWRSIDRLISRDDFLIVPYLLGLVNLKSVSHYYESAALEKRAGDTMDKLAHSLPTIEDTILRRDSWQRIQKMVETLPPGERECVRMRFFQEMSNEAIARQLGLSKKTVERRLMAGIRLLRDQKGLIYSYPVVLIGVFNFP
jgi:RNA polymerase sigma factor (sigma-70 family)